jgi:hypothetical protein
VFPVSGRNRHRCCGPARSCEVDPSPHWQKAGPGASVDAPRQASIRVVRGAWRHGRGIPSDHRPQSCGRHSRHRRGTAPPTSGHGVNDRDLGRRPGRCEHRHQERGLQRREASSPPPLTAAGDLAQASQHPVRIIRPANRVLALCRCGCRQREADDLAGCCCGSPHHSTASPATFADIHASTALSSHSFLCGETAIGSGKPPVLRSRQSVDLDNCTLFWTSSMPMRRSRSVKATDCNFLSCITFLRLLRDVTQGCSGRRKAQRREEAPYCFSVEKQALNARWHLAAKASAESPPIPASAKYLAQKSQNGHGASVSVLASSLAGRPESSFH